MDSSEPTTEESDSINPHNRFDELPSDLRLDILGRLEPKLAAGAAASVSKSWHRLITSQCLPKTKPPFASALVFPGGAGGLRGPRAAFFCHGKGAKAVPAGDVFHKRLSLFPPWIVRAAELQYSLADCSNGLLLFRHVGGADEAAYRVFNYATRQSVCVDAKPLRHGETRSRHAVLAYAPARSSFFRIVQFDRLGTGSMDSMKVYWSETRRWKRVAYMLDEHIVEAEWSEQSFFLGGAVYRVSDSGHLLKFVVEKMRNLLDQAVAIELPKEAPKEFSKMSFGVSENRIHFMSFDEGSCLWIWSLSEDEDGKEWVVRDVVEGLHLRPEFEGSFMKPLGFHPNSNVAFVGANSKTLGSSVLWIRFGGDDDEEDEENQVEYVHYQHKNFIEDWRGVVAFPSLYCDVPFASGFEKKPSCTW